MAIRCSVLGHDFGGPEREREHDSRGGEVVVTTREIETCRNCGETRIVSESKEVTAAGRAPASADDVTPGPTSPTDAAETRRSDAGTSTESEESVPNDDYDATSPPTNTKKSATDDRVIRSDTEATPTRKSTASEPQIEPDTNVTRADPADPTDSTNDTIEYDLEDHGLVGPDTHSRDTPNSLDNTSPTDQPPTAHDSSTSHEPPTTDHSSREDASATENRKTDAPDTGIDRLESERRLPHTETRERGHGEWPAEPESRFDGAIDSGGAADRANRTQAGWDSPLDGGRDDRDWRPSTETTTMDEADRIPAEGVTQGALVCPTCGFEESVAASALRAGDICPECSRGYLSWETRKG